MKRLLSALVLSLCIGGPAAAQERCIGRGAVRPVAHVRNRVRFRAFAHAGMDSIGAPRPANLMLSAITMRGAVAITGRRAVAVATATGNADRIPR